MRERAVDQGTAVAAHDGTVGPRGGRAHRTGAMSWAMCMRVASLRVYPPQPLAGSGSPLALQRCVIRIEVTEGEKVCACVCVSMPDRGCIRPSRWLGLGPLSLFMVDAA